MKIKMKLESADTRVVTFRGINSELPILQGNDYEDITFILPRENRGEYSNRPSWGKLGHPVEISVEIQYG